MGLAAEREGPLVQPTPGRFYRANVTNMSTAQQIVKCLSSVPGYVEVLRAHRLRGIHPLGADACLRVFLPAYRFEFRDTSITRPLSVTELDFLENNESKTWEEKDEDE